MHGNQSKMMRWLIWALFFLISTLSASSSSPAPAAFVGVQDGHFQLNGSPFLFNGFNSYWMMSVATDPNQRNKVTQVFRDAAAAGLTVCRTWAFNDGGFHALQISPGVYDESVFQGLDFVIFEARKYGIRMILSLVNNFKDYGGRAAYVRWAEAAGVQVHDEDDFYTNQLIKTYYKNHVQKVLSRKNTMNGLIYMEDATIMGWELMNEPRCQVDSSGNTVNRWVEEMGSYVKSIDKQHLVGIGMEGFYGDSSPNKIKANPGSFKFGTDFITNNLNKAIDFATIHAYPDAWLPGKSEGTKMAFLEEWIALHWTDSKTILKKPLIFEEFGKSIRDQNQTSSSVRDRDAFLSKVFSIIYNLARNGATMAGGLVWQVMAEGMESYYDGYEIVLSQTPSTTAIITHQSNNMAALNTRTQHHL
ncbi:mannan endo-1,4-beta-mannosidase 1 [Cucumis sativus]|uniref:mannan endo-1,4-beta-mannosidase n=1 Tax=Cucumis sativus TaxID=3659 RepID=A0A0A0KSS2_CUCSA|nr:mannan endo-1,4-beta-mannosidase 1 [Cucumis sativus]KGN52650.1 hypothetical protein Csa_008142 [Cucumis sativus]